MDAGVTLVDFEFQGHHYTQEDMFERALDSRLQGCAELFFPCFQEMTDRIFSTHLPRVQCLYVALIPADTTF